MPACCTRCGRCEGTMHRHPVCARVRLAVHVRARTPVDLRVVDGPRRQLHAVAARAAQPPASRAKRLGARLGYHLRCAHMHLLRAAPLQGVPCCLRACWLFCLGTREGHKMAIKMALLARASRTCLGASSCSRPAAPAACSTSRPAVHAAPRATAAGGGRRRAACSVSAASRSELLKVTARRRAAACNLV